MEDHIVVIDEDPETRLAAFNSERTGVLLGKRFLNPVDKRPDLRFRFRGADDKKVGQGGELADLVDNNFLSMLRLGDRGDQKRLCLGIPCGFL